MDVKSIFLCFAFFTMIAGCTNTASIRGMSVESAVVEAAIAAKAATMTGKLEVELAVVYTGKVGISYPAGIVPLDASLTQENSTKVKVTIEDLSEFQPPREKLVDSVDLWEFNPVTGELKRLP